MRRSYIRSKAVTKLLSALVFLSLAFSSFGLNPAHGGRAQQPLAELQTETPLVTPTNTPVTLADSCITTDGLGRLTVDNSLGNGATHGCLIDYSSFPVVRVTVHNDHGFWTKIALFDNYNDVSVVADNVWAKLGYIAPDAYAEYILTFDSSYNSRVMFFINAAQSEDDRPSAGWWNVVSKILSVLNIDLIGAQLGDLQYVLQAAESSQHLVLAADALSRFALPKFLTEFHEALEDEAEINILIAIAARFGQTISVSAFKAIFTFVKIILTAKDTWETVWSIITGSYAGSVVFASQVQPDPPPPHPNPTPPPLSTPTPPPSTDNATFVSDVTLPNGTVVSPGQALHKVWRVRNSGTSTWGSDYQLVFIGGEQMGAPGSVSVPTTAPDATADIAVDMTAPSTPGAYTGRWRLRNAQGVYFGDELWVQINVQSPSSHITTFTVDPPSPSDTNSVHIHVRVEDFPNFRAMRLKIDGNVVYELGAPEFYYDWNTSGYAAGDHSVVVEVADQTDTSWSRPEQRGMIYTLQGNSGTVNHAPNRPSPSSPYDWYVYYSGNTAQLCAQANGDPDDGDTITGYYFDIYNSAQLWNGGWVGGNCVTTGALGPYNYPGSDVFCGHWR